MNTLLFFTPRQTSRNRAIHRTSNSTPQTSSLFDSVNNQDEFIQNLINFDFSNTSNISRAVSPENSTVSDDEVSTNSIHNNSEKILLLLIIVLLGED